MCWARKSVSVRVTIVAMRDSASREHTRSLVSVGSLVSYCALEYTVRSASTHTAKHTSHTTPHTNHTRHQDGRGGPLKFQRIWCFHFDLRMWPSFVWDKKSVFTTLQTTHRTPHTAQTTHRTPHTAQTTHHTSQITHHKSHTTHDTPH